MQTKNISADQWLIEEQQQSIGQSAVAALSQTESTEDSYQRLSQRYKELIQIKDMIVNYLSQIQARLRSSSKNDQWQVIRETLGRLEYKWLFENESIKNILATAAALDNSSNNTTLIDYLTIQLSQCSGSKEIVKLLKNN